MKKFLLCFFCLALALMSVPCFSQSVLDGTASVYLCTVKFVNFDGTELQSNEVEYGVLPVYVGATPTKPSDSEYYKFVFCGWDSEIVPVTEDKVYTATFVKRPVVKDGLLKGAFSVSADKRVRFSQGSLQYNAALGTHQCADGTTQQGTWRFAENQCDTLGYAQKQKSQTYNGWISAFAWGTSGWNSGANIYQPWIVTGDDPENYYVGGSKDNNLTGEYAFADWGVYNSIFNGGNQPNLWRTLTYDEWMYLLQGRPNAENLCSYVKVGGLYGTLILPDDFSVPSDVQFLPQEYPLYVDLTMNEWFLMEDNGAVFLVTDAGYTFSNGNGGWGSGSVYWSTTQRSVEQAYAISCAKPYFDRYRCDSGLVRLVREAKYNITFLNDNGDDLQSESLDYGAIPEYKGATPTKPATAQYTYTFNGWDKDITTVKGDADYTATYSSVVNKYEIKFVNYDGTELQKEELEYGATPEYKGSVPVKPADTQYTYTFTGWEPGIVEVTGPKTYTAQFSSTTNKYTVRFLNDDGEVLQSESLDYGVTPEYKGATPTKPATAQYTYTFNGWDKAITTVAEATDYTATYSSTVNKYEVKFVNYDGEELQSEELEYGETPAYKGSTPVKPADAQYTYTFSGWLPTITEVTGAHTYTAQFTSTTNKYLIRFLNDNGDVLQSESLDYGATPEYKGATPTKPATAQYTYTFNGWDKSITTVTEATDYTATYSSTVNKYEVKFVNYDGTELQKEELEYGDTPEYKGQIPVKPADAQYNYTFSGWESEIVEVTEAKTYIAQFSSTTNKYTIRFLNDDGEVLQSESLDYGAIPEYKGSTPTKPATAQHTYTFAGWDKTITTVAEATDYTATYSSTVNKYTVKTIAQTEGVITGDGVYDYGETATLTATPNERYEFTGWSNGKTSATIEIVVTKDTTLTAYFQFKPCTVEKDIEVSVPEGGELILKSGKTIIVTKSQKIDDIKITPLKCDSLFHYNIIMVRQNADNTPECDNAPSVVKYDWLLMINVKALNSLGYTFGEGNVTWYKIVGTIDNLDDPASMHTDQMVGNGYGYTIDKSFVGTGDYYALIDLPRQTSDVGCKGIMRTQVFRYGASKRSAPAVIPTIARPSQKMQVMNLPNDENTEVFIYDNVGKLCRQFASHGTDTAEFEAEMRQGSYIVVIKSADGTESVKYIVK